MTAEKAMTDAGIPMGLKPCPFCGNDGAGPIEEALHASMAEHDWRDPSWTVQCDKCTATMGYSDSEDKAVEAWNTRAIADTPPPAAAGDRSLAINALVEECKHLNGWLSDVAALDMDEVVADGGITAAMVVRQEAGDRQMRLRKALQAVFDARALALRSPEPNSGGEGKAPPP